MQSFIIQILKNTNGGICLRIQNIGGLKIDGPPLVVAIESGNAEMVDSLQTKFGANIDQEIIWAGNVSTILIYAMGKALE